MYAPPCKHSVVAALLAAAASSASAQQAAQQKPASELYLDATSGYYSYDNYENLQNPSGTTRLWTTDLTFGYDSETKAQKLGFAAGGRFEAGDFAEYPNRTNQWKNTFGILDYYRESNTAFFRSNLSYRETDNGINVEEDREIESSTDLIVDQGTRSDAHTEFELGVGRGTPTWATGEFAYHRWRYFDTTSTELSDQDSVRFDGEIGLGLSRATSLLITTSYRDTNDIQNINDDETYYSMGVGVQSDLRPDLSMRGVLRYEHDRTKDNATDGKTKIEDGPAIDLSLQQQRKNGSLRFGIVGDRDRNGLRTTVNIGRAMELPHGLIDASFGMSSLESGDVAPVGAVKWQRVYRTRAFSLNYNTSAFTDDDGAEILRNRLGFSLTQELTRLDGLQFSVSYASADNFSSGKSEYRQAAANLEYFREIGREMSFVTGYQHSHYKGKGDDKITDNTIFARIDRRFSLRP